MPKPKEKRSKSSSYQVYSTGGRENEAFLGPLEAIIMETCWNSKNKPLTVREVFETIEKKREIAYTTVMNTMDRLYDKGLLDRSMKKGRGGVIYVYWPQKGEEEFKREGVKAVIDSLIANFGELVTESIMERSPANDEVIETLKKKLEKSKR